MPMDIHHKVGYGVSCSSAGLTIMLQYLDPTQLPAQTKHALVILGAVLVVAGFAWPVPIWLIKVFRKPPFRDRIPALLGIAVTSSIVVGCFLWRAPEKSLQASKVAAAIALPSPLATPPSAKKADPAPLAPSTPISPSKPMGSEAIHIEGGSDHSLEDVAVVGFEHPIVVINSSHDIFRNIEIAFTAEEYRSIENKKVEDIRPKIVSLVRNKPLTIAVIPHDVEAYSFAFGLYKFLKQEGIKILPDRVLLANRPNVEPGITLYQDMRANIIIVGRKK